MTALSKYHGKTIVITGSHGYIGSALAQALAQVPCRLRLVHHSADAWLPSGQATVQSIVGDVTERALWPGLLRGAHVVFHLANREYRYRDMGDPADDLAVNALSVLHLLEVCRQISRPPRIVFASSANLYGRAQSMPVNETALDDPLTTWSIHKLTAELYLQRYAEQFHVASNVLRLANVYGSVPNPAAQERVVINKVIARALRGQGLTLYANHEALRDFVHIDDVVKALLQIGTQRLVCDGRPYIVGSGLHQTLAQTWACIAAQIYAQTGAHIPVKTDRSVAIEPLEMRHFVADSRRLKGLTGWQPAISLADGIAATVHAFREPHSASGVTTNFRLHNHSES